MKKNTMMRVASVLLIAVLLSTCAISGTFAKYVTSQSGSDSARVAKWGVSIVSNGQMFGQHYNGTTDDKLSLTYTGSVDSQGLINGIDKLVAPGTKGDMVTVALKGRPEVACQVSYKAEVTLTGWTVNSEHYCPIVIYVNGTPSSIGAGVDPAYLEQAIEDAIADYKSPIYPAGTDLSTVGADALNISWEWPFSTSADNDVKDTALGNQAASYNPATITISVTTTVTQID